MINGVPSVDRARDLEVLREVASYQGVSIPHAVLFLTAKEWGASLPMVCTTSAFGMAPWGVAIWTRSDAHRP